MAVLRMRVTAELLPSACSDYLASRTPSCDAETRTGVQFEAIVVLCRLGNLALDIEACETSETLSAIQISY